MVREERRDQALWLTLDEPDRLNALVGQDYRTIRVAVEAASAEPTVRAIVLTGNGRAFSSGADRSLIDGTASDEDRRVAAEEFVAMFEAMGRCDSPILAAVNGVAVGVGCTILLHCDFILMAESARLRFPFTALGLVPEAASSVLLPARARWSDSLWAMLSGEWLDANQAQAMGLAWRVVADAELVGETERAVAALAANDPAAVAATKRLMTIGRDEVVRLAIDREFAAMLDLRSQP